MQSDHRDPEASTETPDLNTGKPWAPADIVDLRLDMDRDDSPEEIAMFLCRSTSEVLDRIAAVRRDDESEAADAERWRAATPAMCATAPSRRNA